MIDDVDVLVREAVSKVFDTMLHLQITPLPTSVNPDNHQPHVAGSVGFIGQLSGVVYLYATTLFARHITSRLLGISESDADSDEMVNDAIGELANMVVGQLKSRLSDRGLPCVLTIPSIVRGSHFTIEAVSSTTRRVNVFRCLNHHLVIDTLIKPTS